MLGSCHGRGKAPHHFVQISWEHREDLWVWDLFLEQFNGWSFWQGPVVQTAELDLFTDAAGLVGYAAYFNGRWCAGRWPEVLSGLSSFGI